MVLSFPSALSPIPPPGAACRGRRLGRGCVGDSESERNGRFGVDAFVCCNFFIYIKLNCNCTVHFCCKTSLNRFPSVCASSGFLWRRLGPVGAPPASGCALGSPRATEHKIPPLPPHPRCPVPHGALRPPRLPPGPSDGSRAAADAFGPGALDGSCERTHPALLTVSSAAGLASHAASPGLSREPPGPPRVPRPLGRRLSLHWPLGLCPGRPAQALGPSQPQASPRGRAWALPRAVAGRSCRLLQAVVLSRPQGCGPPPNPATLPGAPAHVLRGPLTC